MIGTTLLGMMFVATIGGFLVGWPLVIAHRVHTGHPPSSVPPDDVPWNLGDVLRVFAHRFWTGRFVDWTPRRHVPWKLIDVLLIVLPIVLLMAGPLLLGEPPKQADKPPPHSMAQNKLSVVLDVGIKAILLGLGTAYLVVKARAVPRDLGLEWRNLKRNAVIGVAAFALIAPPVYAVQVIFVQLGGWKYSHPLIDMLKDVDPLLFGMLAVSACIMAPLSEEWLFRGLLQGWLERAFAWLTGTLSRIPPSPAESAHSPTGDIPAPRPTGFGEPFASTFQPTDLGPPEPAEPLNPYLASVETPLLEPGDHLPNQVPPSLPERWLPILISSLLFGLAHWGHGPAPISLTFLAIGLGYVYQRTHSIVPTIVVHALFNGFSILALYAQVFELKQPLP